MSLWKDNEEIKIFREYLRIPSVHPDVNYEPCVAFLKVQADQLGLKFKVEAPVTPKKPVVVMTLIGTKPELKSILLNSHMDVVPAVEEFWTHKPFDADIDEEGRIFARGSQDMKSVGMQYLAAIRYFKRKNIQFKRTIHVTFVPEEEIGWVGGMKDFVQQESFKKLNVGFLLDEGIASPTEIFNVFYAEKSCWRVHFKIQGATGHGSMLFKDTASDKLTRLLDRIIDYRNTQIKRLDENPELTASDVTSVNVTIVNGGVQANVIPPEIKVVTDIRLALDVDHQQFEDTLKRWCDESGSEISLGYEAKEPKVEATKIDQSNPYWVAFKGSLDAIGLKTNVVVFAAGTDARHIRSLSIPAIGFSPLNNTPPLAHGHDEFLHADTYLRGIEVYKQIISHIANVD